jgi:hypothetical protein
VRRVLVVLALAASCAGVAATLAATARDRGTVDPETDARPDGCGRDYLAQSQRQIPTWVYVGDRNAPATGPAPPLRRLDGVVSSPFDRELAVHPTPEDLPTIHRSYDLNFNVLPDAAGRTLLGGSAATRTGNYAGRGESTARVHVEREQGATPLFVWPEAGDRVSLVGSWIWDCGHWTGGGEKTEIHPFDVLWVDRREHWPQAEGDLFVSTDKTFAGVQADCAHQVKGVVAAFQACLLTHSSWQDVSGTYRFRLHVPPRPSPSSILQIRVVDAGSTPGAPPVIARSSGGGVDVRLAVHATPGRKLVVAKRVIASWTGTAPADHLRVRFVRLLVRRAMDPGCSNGRPACGSKETTHGEQVSFGPGEWNVYVDGAGTWRMWGSGLLRARDGQVFRNGPTLDLHLARGKPWRVFVFTRECDFGSLGNADGATHAMAPCPRSREFGTFDGDDVPGIAVAHFRSPAAALGLHVLRPQRHGSTCPAVNRLGCYEIAFPVERAGRV